MIHIPLIEFEEDSHTYFIDKVAMNRSVTELVGTFFPHFDSTATAIRMLAREDFIFAPQYEQYRVILQDMDPKSQEAIDLIVSTWKKEGSESSSLGTIMHKSIEEYYRSGKKPEPITKEFSLFEEFDTHVIDSCFLPFRSEQIVYDLDLSLAGSVDMLYVHRDHIDNYPTRVWLVDWKRSKEIKMRGYNKPGTRQVEKGYPPFDHLDNCNYYHYSAQLNLYKYLLERNHGMIVDRMTLVILHPKQKKYIAIEVNDMQDLIIRALNRREG